MFSHTHKEKREKPKYIISEIKEKKLQTNPQTSERSLEITVNNYIPMK